MSEEDIEKTTIDNAHAIGELTIIAKQTSKDVDKLIKHLDTVPAARTISLEKRMTIVESMTKTFVSSSTIKWAVVIMLAIIGGYMTQNESKHDFAEKEIHRLDNLAAEKINMQRQINKNVEGSLNRHEEFLGIKKTPVIIYSEDGE